MSVQKTYEVGSSSKTNDGLPTRAMATDNFLLFPPLNVKHILFMCSFKSSKSIRDKHVFRLNSFRIPLRRLYISIVSNTVI